MEGEDLFCRSDIPSGTPRSHVRLAEMITLLCPPPPELVERAREAQKVHFLGSGAGKQVNCVTISTISSLAHSLTKMVSSPAGEGRVTESYYQA